MQPVDDRERAIKARARRQRSAQVQRRRLVLLAVVVIVIVVIVALAVRSCGDGGTVSSSTTGTSSTTEPTGTSSASSSYTADLTGADSVPAVDTQATAVLTLDYDSAAKEIAFTLEVTSQISNPSLATIYKGLPGEHGDAVYTLFGGPAKEGDFEGMLAEGTIVEDDLTGSLELGTIADLIALIADGDAYVNIGNASHPVDAIRGPIK